MKPLTIIIMLWTFIKMYPYTLQKVFNNNKMKVRVLIEK